VEEGYEMIVRQSGEIICKRWAEILEQSGFRLREFESAIWGGAG
jgi:hypothetical protein